MQAECLLVLQDPYAGRASPADGKAFGGQNMLQPMQGIAMSNLPQLPVQGAKHIHRLAKTAATVCNHGVIAVSIRPPRRQQHLVETAHPGRGQLPRRLRANVRVQGLQNIDPGVLAKVRRQGQHVAKLTLHR